jgi:hypothetical protein
MEFFLHDYLPYSSPDCPEGGERNVSLAGAQSGRLCRQGWVGRGMCQVGPGPCGGATSGAVPTVMREVAADWTVASLQAARQFGAVADLTHTHTYHHQQSRHAADVPLCSLAGVASLSVAWKLAAAIWQLHQTRLWTACPHDARSADCLIPRYGMSIVQQDSKAFQICILLCWPCIHHSCSCS